MVPQPLIDRDKYICYKWIARKGNLFLIGGCTLKKIELGKTGKGLLGLGLITGLFLLGIFSGKKFLPISLRKKEAKKTKEVHDGPKI